MAGPADLESLLLSSGQPSTATGPNRGEMGPTDRVQPDGGGAALFDMISRGRPQPGDGGGGGMPGAMIQKLQELMQSPVARQGMQQFAQQAGLNIPGLSGGGGGDPRARMAAEGIPPNLAQSPAHLVTGPDAGELATGPQTGGFSSPTTDAALYEAQEANQGVRGRLRPIPDTGGMTGYGEEFDPQKDPRQTPEAMVEQEIERKGATFDGVDAPTKNDIDRLFESQSDATIEAFDAQFGQGAASKILGKPASGDPDEDYEE